MSTPCGVHVPIDVAAFRKRVFEWQTRMLGVDFQHMDYEDAFEQARAGDLVYCDPPYVHSQSILYGAQDFSFVKLLLKIDEAKSKGVRVALSIDGRKKSGATLCHLEIPDGLFESEVFLSTGRSMLRRFQLEGQTLEHEVVEDRLLLTYH